MRLVKENNRYLNPVSIGLSRYRAVKVMATDEYLTSDAGLLRPPISISPPMPDC